jgi:NAD-dependent dihydropyrimidine dehydrogenase PreA subunit
MTRNREKIPWFPTVDKEKCTGCEACFEFCPHHVYEIEEGKSAVKNPYNCVVGCSNCRGLCPVTAISFPEIQEVREIMKKPQNEEVI